MTHGINASGRRRSRTLATHVSAWINTAPHARDHHPTGVTRSPQQGPKTCTKARGGRHNRAMRYVILLLVSIALLTGAWWLTQPKPITVTLHTVARGAVRATVSNTRVGTVEACHRARMSPSVPGQVAVLPVREGPQGAFGSLRAPARAARSGLARPGPRRWLPARRLSGAARSRGPGRPWAGSARAARASSGQRRRRRGGRSPGAARSRHRSPPRRAACHAAGGGSPPHSARADQENGSRPHRRRPEGGCGA